MIGLGITFNICGIYKLAKDNQKQKEKSKVLKKIK